MARNMSAIEPPHRENYKGLSVHYLNGGKNKASVVIAKDIWFPGKEFGWMFLLNRLGFNVAYAPYRGTWLSQGEFISHADSAMSLTEDISDLIRSSLEKFGSSEVFILSYSLGGPPSLMASTRCKEVSKIFMYGAPIYTDDSKLNRKYETEGDSVAKVGANLSKLNANGGYFFGGYTGFSLEAYNKMILGGTQLNPYKSLRELSQKQIFAMHSVTDKLVHCDRTVDFVNALKQFCKENGIEPKIELELIDDGRGHRNGFGLEELFKAGTFFSGTLAPGVIERLKNFIKQNQRKIQKSDGEWLSVPFYDCVVRHVRELQKENTLHQEPSLEEILAEIF